MGQCTGVGTPVNSFSLVAYLPEPLASFVDQLRRDVQPGCTARGHVTLLPPRPLDYLEQAYSEIEAVMRDAHSFEVQLADVCVFEGSKVIHLSIGEGAAKLDYFHRLLNRGCCTHSEVFHYHPHVTLAQGIPPETVEHARQVAEQRWADYRGPRKFEVETLTLVQNTVENEWQNLREFSLRTPTIAMR